MGTSEESSCDTGNEGSNGSNVECCKMKTKMKEKHHFQMNPNGLKLLSKCNLLFQLMSLLLLETYEIR